MKFFIGYKFTYYRYRNSAEYLNSHSFRMDNSFLNIGIFHPIGLQEVPIITVMISISKKTEGVISNN